MLKNHQLIGKIKKMPICMTVTAKPHGKKTNCKFYIEKKTGIVKVLPLIKLSKLYKKSHGSGTIGITWKNHHQTFYNFLKKYLKGNILEIGAGDNSMQNFIKKFKLINNYWSIGKNIRIKNKKIKIINSFFSESLIKKKKIQNCELVIHSHLFEHIQKPNIFLKNIHSCLRENGYHIFSVPNMKPMIKKGMANAVNFEHPYYYDENLIEVLLLNNGFKIIKKIYFGKCHSIMYLTQKDKKKYVKKYFCFKKNLKIFKNLFNKWKKDIDIINKNIKQNKTIFFFGGHIFSQLILTMGTFKKINGILDNDINKQNKFLYGTTFKIFSPQVLKKFNKPVIYMRIGDYEREVKTQLISINKKCKFI